MNTKTITLSVFATLFMGAYVVLCSMGLSGNACVAFWLSIAFAAAALLCVAADYYVDLCEVRDIRAKVTEQEKNIENLKLKVEDMKVPSKKASIKEIQKHNGELQDLLKKLTNFGDALNQVKKELDEIAQQQKQKNS